MNIIDFIESEQLTPGSFEGDSWERWKAILSAAFALPMDDEQVALFKEVAGDREPPTERVRELFAVAGRRSAKSNVASAVAVYLATVGAAVDGLLDRLSPGERGVIQLIAVDRDQAKVLMGYIGGLFDSSPTLNAMVTKRGTEGIDLNNRVSIQVSTNSFKSVRGRTSIAVLMDECAFFKDENSSSPDTELYRAIVPSLATTGGILIGISSPYSKKGLLYDKWRQHFGTDSDCLVIQGETRQFNPTIDQRVIDDAIADDPEGARSEWLGQFRDDISGFISRELVEDATRTSPLEIPYDRHLRSKYRAFVDPAGGGKDEFCIAIGHFDRKAQQAVVDVVRGMSGTPATITEEYADLMAQYGLRKGVSDKYAGSWPADEFSRYGIQIEQSADPKSQLYVDSLARFSSGQVNMPPDSKLQSQLCNLERRTSRSGRDTVDHPQGNGQHDDRANAVAGLLSLLRGRQKPPLKDWL